jgi:hypothetical protein
MSASSRLSTTLIEGMLTLPDGPVCLMRPSLDYDVNELPRERLSIVHTFKPDAAGKFCARKYGHRCRPAR